MGSRGKAPVGGLGEAEAFLCMKHEFYGGYRKIKTGVPLFLEHPVV